MDTFRTISLILFLATFFTCESPKEEQSPNIIFLLTDDQRWDAAGIMGNPIIQTPQMDQLGREGVVFENAYVTTPICCTSRASIFSGQYARRHGINDFKTFFADSSWQDCYPLQLKQAGYQLGFIGKFGVGRPEDLPAKDFDFWRGIPGQPKYEHQDEHGQYIHLTEIMGNQAIEFLDSVRSDQPFCLSLSFKAPHVQDNDPRQFLFDSTYLNLYQEQTIPAPQTSHSFYEFPDFFKLNNEARRRWEIRFSDSLRYQESVKGYYRLIYGVDQVLGKIRSKLAEHDLTKNTIIVLMGDNGFFLGEKGLAGKWYAYEESIRVPLIIFDPRLPVSERGQIIQKIALNIDLAPTFLSIANQPSLPGIQGKDLSSLYFGNQIPWRSDFLFEHLFNHPRIPSSEGVVSLKEKYFRYLPPAPEWEEAYDLEADPSEKTNLVRLGVDTNRVNRLRARLEGLVEEMK